MKECQSYLMGLYLSQHWQGKLHVHKYNLYGYTQLTLHHRQLRRERQRAGIPRIRLCDINKQGLDVLYSQMCNAYPGFGRISLQTRSMEPFNPMRAVCACSVSNVRNRECAYLKYLDQEPNPKCVDSADSITKHSVAASKGH